MDFSDYKCTNKKFLQKYSKYIEQYPNAFLLIEKYLRTLADPLDSQNASALIIDYGTIRMFKIFYRVYFKLTLILRYKFLMNKHSGCYIYNLDRLPGLNHFFLTCKSISIIQKPASILSYFSFNKIDIYSILSSNYKIIKFYRRITSSNIESILEQKDIMKNLDSIVFKELELAELILRIYKIRSLVATGDDHPVMRMLCSASKSSKTEVNIVAHGYIGHPSLLTIAPIYADKLFVWTQLQKNELKRDLDETNANKIFYEGSPLFINNKHTFKKTQTVLFVLSCLPVDELENGKALLIIDKYISIILTFSFNVEIRFHPQDCGNYKSFIQKYRGKVFKSENISVYDSIVSSVFLISSPTSIIIQAIHNGKNVFQIEELSNGNYYEQVHPVNLSTISDQIKLLIQGLIKVPQQEIFLKPHTLVSKACLLNN